MANNTLGIKKPNLTNFSSYPNKPIFGAPIMFELIRSYNILNTQDTYNSTNITDFSGNEVNINLNVKKINLNNIFETTNSLESDLRYEGYYFHPSRVVNFDRQSIVNSNPYILLTDNDILANAKAIEEDFTCSSDIQKIKNAVEEYWNRQVVYDKIISNEISLNINVDVNRKYHGYFPGQHLIYAYMMENTRIIKIFEKIIGMYSHGEDLTIPYNGSTKTKRWIENSKALFFSNAETSIWKKNQYFENSQTERCNAYFRMLGLDLNHGYNDGTPFTYIKANHNNAGLMQELEVFLKLCWQMVINFSNTSSINTTDLLSIKEQADALQHSLLARRSVTNSLENYTALNLSRIEYESVLMTQWFYHAISYNSPIVQEMSAEAVTPNERLRILGRRVEISVPSKSGNFIDLASQLATLFRLLELGEVDTSYISSIANPITRPYALIMGILYNYQQATGKDLKSQVFVNNNNKILSIS